MLIVYKWAAQHWTIAFTGLGNQSFHFTWNNSSDTSAHCNRPRNVVQPCVDIDFMIEAYGELEWRIGIPSLQDGNVAGADEAACYNWLFFGEGNLGVSVMPTGPASALSSIYHGIATLSRCVTLPINRIYMDMGLGIIPLIDSNHCLDMVFNLLKAAFIHHEHWAFAAVTAAGFNTATSMVGDRTLLSIQNYFINENMRRQGYVSIGRTMELFDYKALSAATNLHQEHNCDIETFAHKHHDADDRCRNAFLYIWMKGIWDSKISWYQRLSKYYLREHVIECREAHTESYWTLLKSLAGRVEDFHSRVGAPDSMYTPQLYNENYRQLGVAPSKLRCQEPAAFRTQFFGETFCAYIPKRDYITSTITVNKREGRYLASEQNFAWHQTMSRRAPRADKHKRSRYFGTQIVRV